MTTTQVIERLRELGQHDDAVVLIEDDDGYRHEIAFVQIAFVWDQKRIVITAERPA